MPQLPPTLTAIDSTVRVRRTRFVRTGCSHRSTGLLAGRSPWCGLVSDPEIDQRSYCQYLHANFVLPPVPLDNTSISDRASSCKLAGAANGLRSVQSLPFDRPTVCLRYGYGRFCRLHMCYRVVTVGNHASIAHPSGARTWCAHPSTQLRKLPHHGNYAYGIGAILKLDMHGIIV